MIQLGLSKDWWQAQIDEKRANTEKLKQPTPAPVAPTNGNGQKEMAQQLKSLRQDLALYGAALAEIAAALATAESDLVAARKRIEGWKAADAHTAELLDGAQTALAAEESLMAPVAVDHWAGEVIDQTAASIR